MLNVHPSLLPRWRGAAPVERAIMAGDPRDGVSIMRLTAGLDSGPVCLQARADRARRRLRHAGRRACRRLGADLLVRALDERPPCAEQPERGGDLRREDRGRGPLLRPASARPPSSSGRSRAAPPHRRAGRAAGGRGARRRPPRARRRRRRRRARRARRARGAPAARRAPTGRSSSRRSGPRAAGRWTPPRTCADIRCDNRCTAFRRGPAVRGSRAPIEKVVSTMRDRGFERFAPLAGVVFLLLAILSFALRNRLPTPTTSTAKVIQLLVGARLPGNRLGDLVVFAALFIVWFGASLRTAICAPRAAPAAWQRSPSRAASSPPWAS